MSIPVGATLVVALLSFGQTSGLSSSSQQAGWLRADGVAGGCWEHLIKQRMACAQRRTKWRIGQEGSIPCAEVRTERQAVTLDQWRPTLPREERERERSIASLDMIRTSETLI
jgi:hypothetical protein